MEPDFTTQVQIAADEMGVDAASLYILAGGDLVLAATFGLEQASVGRVRMKPTEGLTGLAFSGAAPLAVAEPASHPRFRHFPESGEDEFHSYLGVPLPKRLGVLVFQTRAKHFYSQSEIRAAVLWAARMAAGWEGMEPRRAVA